MRPRAWLTSRARHLRGVRVVGTRVDLQLAPHRFAHLRLGEHAAHGFFDHADRVLLAKILGALLAQPAFEAAVIPVQLLFFLAAGEPDLRGVDDDDVIAGIDVRRVDRLVLALQETRRFGRHPAEDQVLGVDDVPLPLHTAGSGNKRTHENPFGLRSGNALPPNAVGAGGQPFSKDGKPKGY